MQIDCMQEIGFRSRQEGCSMRMHRPREFTATRLAVAFLLWMGAFGCGQVTLIAPYDQTIDDGVTNLQKSTAEFFTKVERQGGSKPEDYNDYTKFYDDAKVTLSGLSVRASAFTNNKLTTEQLVVLSEQFRNLEQTHMKIGISRAAVPEYENAFNRTFTAILTLEIAKKGP
jgi:hypothetical protein